MNKGPSSSCQNACWVSIWLCARSIFVFGFVCFVFCIIFLKRKARREKEIKKGVDNKRRWEKIVSRLIFWLYIASSAVSDINDEYPLVAFRLFPLLSLTHSRLSVRLFFSLLFCVHIGNCWDDNGFRFLISTPQFWVLTLLFFKEPDRFGSLT